MAVDVEHTRSDAKSALDRLAPGSQWRPTAAVLLGSAELFQGDVDSADMHLADAVELGERLGGPAAALALATRALIAIRRGRWDQAPAFLDL